MFVLILYIYIYIYDGYINSYRLNLSLDNQSTINTYLMHESLPIDAHVNMIVCKIINHLIKPPEVLSKSLRPPLKASNGYKDRDLYKPPQN